MTDIKLLKKIIGPINTDRWPCIADGLKVPSSYWWESPEWFIHYNVFTFGDLASLIQSKTIEPKFIRIISSSPFFDVVDGTFKLKPQFDQKEAIFSISLYESFNNPQLVKDSEITKGKPYLRNYYWNGANFVVEYTVETKLKHKNPRFLTEVQDYRYVPEKHVFHGGNPGNRLFFGLELEVSSRVTPEELQYIVTNVEPKQEPFFYFKHDGSILNTFGHTYEIVTFPCSPRFLKAEFRKLFSKLEKLTDGHISDYFDTNSRHTDGLHIHVSRDSFSSRIWRNKFVSVWNQWDKSNQKFLWKLSRRIHPLSENRFCRPHRNMVDKTVAYRLREGAINTGYEDRYASSRETSNTVEVRVFQGKFELDHILYCVTLTKAIHEFTYSMPINSLGVRFKDDFIKWLNKNGKYRSLEKEITQCV